MEKTEKSSLKCANCGKNGHPASYKGCPFIINTLHLNKTHKKALHEARQIKLQKQHRPVNVNHTYANVASSYNTNAHTGNFHNLNSYNHEENPEFNNNNNHNDNHNFNNSDINHLLYNLKTDIIRALEIKINALNESIIFNSSRLDHLYNYFNLNYGGEY